MKTASATHGRSRLAPRAQRLATASILLCSAIAVAAPASAATAPAVPATPTTLPRSVTVEMQVVGFDAAVAKAHGYKIVTVNGRQMSVKASDGITPDNSTPPPVSNSCATVSLSAYYQGNRKESFYWSVSSHQSPIFDYSFDVDVTDSAGTGSKNFWDDFLADETVAGNWQNTSHSVYGNVQAKLSGYIVTVNGTKCSVPNAYVGDWMS